MGKRCDCHGIVEMLERDPRLRSLGLAPRMLWFALVRAMQAMGVSALRLGSGVAKPEEIALLVGCTVTELETQLEPILARGLLEREADGALASPLLRALLRRAEVARNNGLKGGRPRKIPAEGGAQQREMLLPVAGGRAAAETQREPGAAEVGSLAKLEAKIPTAQLAGRVKVPVDDAVYQRVGQAVLALMNIDPARSMVHAGIVRQWLADGASEALILEVVGAKMRPGVASPGYFTKAIADALARAPAAVDLSAKSLAFDAAIAAWRAGGKQGTMPAPAWFAADGSRVAA